MFNYLIYSSVFKPCVSMSHALTVKCNFRCVYLCSYVATSLKSLKTVLFEFISVSPRSVHGAP